jgi:hypothetical protein
VPDFRVAGRSACELQKLIDHLVGQTGRQMYYTDRDMAFEHQGMGITETDWARFIGVDVSVGESNGGEVMVFLDTSKPDILTE